MPDLLDEHLTVHSIYQKINESSFEGIEFSELTTTTDRSGQVFLEQLVQKNQAQALIQTNEARSLLLRHLKIEATNTLRSKGLSTLALGFPHLTCRIEEEYYEFPMFLWEIRTNPVKGRTNLWNFELLNNQLLRANPFMVPFLQKHFALDLEASVEDWIYVKRIAWASLKLQLEQAGIEVPEFGHTAINPDKPHLSWNARLGLFPFYQSVDDTNSFDWTDFNGRNTELTYRHQLGLFPIHPDQAKAFRLIRANDSILVAGAGGTGKSYLIAHILSNALSNGHRSLVISNNIPRLKNIQQLLQGKGIEGLHFLLQNSNRDLHLLLELVRASVKITQRVDFDKDAFNVLLNRCIRACEKLESYHDHASKTWLGDLTWTELVGHYLQNNRIVDKAYLDSHLNAQEFEFDYPTYQRLLGVLEQSEQIYQSEFGLKHPLKTLHPSIYTHYNKTEAEAKAKQLVEKYLEKGYQLQQRYTHKISAYKEKLTDFYEGVYRRFLTKTIYIEEQITDGRNEYGTDLEKVTNLSLYGTFSSKYRKIIELKEHIFDQYDSLIQDFENQQYFNFSFLEAGNWNVVAVEQNLADFKNGLRAWMQALNGQIQEEVKRIHRDNLKNDLDFREQIKELEYALDVLLQELDNAQLFKKAINVKALTITKRQKLLENLIDQLESMAFHLKDFELYYSWQRHWLLCEADECKLLKALLKARPKDWQAAFKSWFFHYCLLSNFDPTLIVPYDTAIADFSTDGKVLKSMLVKQIYDYWINEKVVKSNSLRASERESYQKLTEKNTTAILFPKELYALYNRAWDLVTAVNPVLFATPEVAHQLLSHVDHQFDYLILDQAHFLQFREVNTFLDKGKKVVAFGDSSMKPILNEDSVFAAFKRGKVPKIDLENFYENVFPLQAAIQKGNGTLQASKEMEAKVEQVSGAFDENSNINKAEAEAVLNLLNHFDKGKQDRFPKVGIVTFTKAQRNYLVHLLEQVRAKNVKAARILSGLERHQFGVFALGEGIEERFDVLIISSTFEQIDSDLDVAAIKKLHTPQSACHIRQLINSIRQEVYLIHSLSDANLTKLVEYPSSEASFLMSCFFIYLQAIQNEDTSKRAFVLELLEGNLQKMLEANSTFLEEVALALQPYFEKDRIKHNVAIGNTQQALVVLPKEENGKTISIITEGVLSETYPTNYDWEHKEQLKWNQEEVLMLPVWSVNWWKNAKQEARKLASNIIRQAGKTTSSIE